jgi:hypothetical protein
MERQLMAGVSSTREPDAASAEVTGRVLEADIHRRRFRIWREDGTSVSAPFTEQQEAVVTSALRDHRFTRVRAKGKGEFGRSGQLRRLVRVDSLEAVPFSAQTFDPNAPRIEDELAAIAAKVPAEEWQKLPDDLLDNLDHYIYGTPKR